MEALGDTRKPTHNLQIQVGKLHLRRSSKQSYTTTEHHRSKTKNHLENFQIRAGANNPMEADSPETAAKKPLHNAGDLKQTVVWRAKTTHHTTT
jgi:hypothetical protein